MKTQPVTTQPIADEPLYSVKEWAKSAGISATTAWAHIHAGKIGHYRIGKRVLIGARHRAEYLKAREVVAFAGI